MFPVANFFSVPMMAPERWAWFRAPLPRTTVSRSEDPPLVLLPILVTVSQSSDMVAGWWEFVWEGFGYGFEETRWLFRWDRCGHGYVIWGCA